MSDEPIRLSPKFKFFLTFHFSLGFSVKYDADRQVQLRKLDDIEEALNNKYKFLEYKWSRKEFDDKIPLSLQDKHGCLLGKYDGPTEELQTIINNRSAEYDGVELDFKTITEEVVYFDHGVGSINLLIKRRTWEYKNTRAL